MIYLMMVIFFSLAFCLIGLILLQEGKGGGLAAAGGGAMDAVMGARNPLRRWTVYFCVALLLLILGINYHISRLSPTAVPEGLRPPAEKAHEAAPAGDGAGSPADTSQVMAKEPPPDKSAPAPAEATSTSAPPEQKAKEEATPAAPESTADGKNL